MPSPRSTSRIAKLKTSSSVLGKRKPKVSKPKVSKPRKRK